MRLVLFCGSLIGVCRSVNAQQLVSDQWFEIEFDGQTIGYERIVVRQHSADIRHCQRETRLQLTRLGKDLSLQASLQTVEHSDGRLLEFRLQRTDAAGNRINRSGVIDAATKTLVLTELSKGTSFTRSVPVLGAVYSPIIESWLYRKLINGDSGKRWLVLFPETAQIVEIFGKLKSSHQLRLGSQRIETQRVAFYPAADATRVTQLWFHADTGLVRSEKEVIGGTLRIQRSTVSQALQAASGQSLDLDVRSMIPTTVRKDADVVVRSGELVLNLSVPNGLVPEVPNGAFQSVTRIDTGTVQIRLFNEPQAAKIVEDQQAFDHPLLPIQDLQLQRLAVVAAGSVIDATARAQRIESYVRKFLTQSAFSTQFVSATEIMRGRQGDCTEHAILLCALLRSSGLQARLASGLMTIPQRQAMTGHVWVEAYVDGTWRIFDSSLPESAKKLPRIKLADEAFRSPSKTGMSLFVPLLEIAGKARVEVLSAK